MAIKKVGRRASRKAVSTAKRAGKTGRAKTSVLLASTKNRLLSIFSICCFLPFVTAVEGAANDQHQWMVLATATMEAPPVSFCECYKNNEKMEGTAWAFQQMEHCTVCKLEFIGTITNLGLESIIQSATKPRLYKIVYQIPNDRVDRMPLDKDEAPDAAKNRNVDNKKGSLAAHHGTRLFVYDKAQDHTAYHSKILVKKDNVLNDKEILGLLDWFLELLSDDAVLKSHRQFFRYEVEDFVVNGEHVGVLELVKDSKNLAELLQIQKTFAAACLPRDYGCNDKTFKYLTYDKVKECGFEHTLVTSAAFSSIAGFLLGIGDRHWGNTLISLTPEPIYLHIDFGYVYGETPHIELGFPLSIGFLNLLDDETFKMFRVKMKKIYKKLVDKINIAKLPEKAKDIFLKRSKNSKTLEKCKDVDEDEVWKMVIYNTMWRDNLNYIGTWSPYNPMKYVSGAFHYLHSPKTDMDKLLCVLQKNGATNLNLQEYINDIGTRFYIS